MMESASNPQYLFIVNPLSGAGKGTLVAGLLQKLLPTHPALCDGRAEVILTTEMDAAAFPGLLVRAEAIIVVGGDGTVSTLIPYILACGSSPALSLLPLGTSNDLARAFGISVKADYTKKESLREALDRIPALKEEQLDVFCVNGRLVFCNYFGIGFDAAIVHDFDRLRRLKGIRLIPPGRLTNNLLYLLMGIKNIRFHLEPGIRIYYENENHSRSVDIDPCCRAIIISNLPVYAGGCSLSSDALKNDGMFEITIIHNIYQYIKLILTRFLPFLRSPRGPSRYRARRATINLKAPSPCQVDGEKYSEPDIATTSLEIAFNSKLRILAPRISTVKTHRLS